MGYKVMWKIIDGWPYEVSDGGAVRRIGKQKSLVGAPGTGNYPLVSLSNGTVKVTRLVHRLVALAFLGPPPSPLHVVAHHDGCATNNRLSNLRWATWAENEDDKLRHGRRPLGERVPGAKLNAKIIKQIRSSSRSLSLLSQQFGVYKSTIARIRRRETWAHL